MRLLSVPSKQEIENRIERLYKALNLHTKDWDAAFLVDRVNHYYLAGTMQDGVFVLKKDGSYAYFARKSYERAKTESPIENVYPMKTYRDISDIIGGDVKRIFTETGIITYEILERIKKYFDIQEVLSADKILLRVRAIKSDYELECIEEAGRQQAYMLEAVVPEILKEGMNETEFTAELYREMIKLGHHGIMRFSMFGEETLFGQIGFGDNSIYPTSFNGPGGMKGLHPASPMIGDRSRQLKRGDLVFADVGFGVDGYHTDRTQLYMFGARPSDDIVKIHRECVRIQKEIAALLIPGNIPSKIYNTVLESIEPSFLKNFMGFGSGVKFFGHGVGLRIDESPVIANGVDEPLAENMVIAIEPKKGVEGIGLLGGEDTYAVTPAGGRCLTGGEKDIIVL